MSGVSVRGRIIRMRDTGILKSIHLIPSPLCFRRKASSYVFTKVTNASSRLHDILSVDDVVLAWTDHENDVLVNMYHKSEKNMAGSLNRLSEILGDDYTSAFRPLSLLPPILSESRFSSIDWKLLEHMVSNPRISNSELSRVTHLSRKTVEKHKANILANRQVYPVFISDFTKVSGHIFYGAVALFETQETLKQLFSLDMIPVWIMNEPSGAYFLGFAGSLRDVEVAKSKIGKISEVTSFSISIPTGGVFGTERVGKWIREAIRQWKLSSFSRF